MSNFNAYITCNECIRRVLGPMGLPKPANVFDATDQISRQMIDLLTECGQELLGEYNWQDIIATQTIVTDTNTSYAIPDDWERYIDDTEWNNTGRIPMIGPMTPSQWRMLQARQLGGTTLRLQYVIRANKIVLYYAPTPAQTLQIDYISRGWLIDGTDNTIRRDTVQKSDDLIIYSPRLIVPMLKWRFRESKGFDSMAAKEEYESALEIAKYSDRPHSALPISGRQSYPYLGSQNIPDVNFG